MKLIIDIDKEIYKSIKKECDENDSLIIDTFTYAIGNGTPLEDIKEEYESDMMKLLKEKGLSKAVKKYTDKIDKECRYMGVPYLTHRSIQESLCDILFLLDLYEKENKQ